MSVLDELSVLDEFRRHPDGFGLTTAEITYRLPDHWSILQIFVRQGWDVSPRFPDLLRFLDFWNRELDGPLHSVRVAHRPFLTRAEVRFVGNVLKLN